jgi:hypothetical protein
MSRLRLIFRPPPFKPYRRPQGPGRYARAPQFELPLQSGFRWSYLWYGGVLALGITTGLAARQFAAPLGLPTPGSPEDKLIVESLGQDIDQLDIVRTLRKQSFNLHADAPISGAGSGDKSKVKGWVELAVDPTNDQEGEAKTGILDALSGTRGFGVQRAFWNAETREMVAVVWIGGGLSGWPGVAHGGAIATIFEETMARMVRGPSGAVGMYTIQTLSALSSGRSKWLKKVCEADICSFRTNPPPYLVKHNVREANIQSRFLHTSRVIFATEPTPNRTSSRTRNGTYKELAGMVVSEEGFDQASRF